MFYVRIDSTTLLLLSHFNFGTRGSLHPDACRERESRRQRTTMGWVFLAAAQVQGKRTIYVTTTSCPARENIRLAQRGVIEISDSKLAFDNPKHLSAWFGGLTTMAVTWIGYQIEDDSGTTIE